MKHAIVVAHPKPDSFTLTIANAYAEALRARGHAPLLRDLYRMDFDPRLGADEIPHPDGFAPAADVKAERALLADVEAYAFVYPLWFNAPPAMLKGYVDRVFGMGFGYGPVSAGGNQPLLEGKTLITFTSSGAPNAWVVESGAWEAMRRHFDHHVAAVCGLRVLDHLNFGGVRPGMGAEAVARCVRAAEGAAAQFFPAA